MATEEEIQAAIDEAKTSPLRMRNGTEETENHRLADVIALEKHQAAKAAGGMRNAGIRVMQIRHGGTV